MLPITIFFSLIETIARKAAPNARDEETVSPSISAQVSPTASDPAETGLARHGRSRTAIAAAVLFSLLFAALAILSLPIGCVASDSPECRETLFIDPM